MKRIADTSLGKNELSSKFLRRSESPIPTKQRRLNYIFKYKKSKMVEDKIAFALIKKYDDVNLVDKDHNILNVKDDLDDLNGNEIRSLASKYGINTWGKKADVLKETIREARRNGVEPEEDK